MQTYRRSRHSVSLLHAHLVFVTTYRRAVFTDAMLSFCEHTMPSVAADLDAEPVEFNGEAAAEAHRYRSSSNTSTAEPAHPL